MKFKILAGDKRWHMQYSTAVLSLLYGAKAGVSDAAYAVAEESIKLARCGKITVSEGIPEPHRSVWHNKKTLAYAACSGNLDLRNLRDDVPLARPLIRLAWRVLERRYAQPPAVEEVLDFINAFSYAGLLFERRCHTPICKTLTSCFAANYCTTCDMSLAIKYVAKFSIVDFTQLYYFQDKRMALVFAAALSAFPVATLLILYALDQGDGEMARAMAHIHPLAPHFPIDIDDWKTLATLTSLSIPAQAI